MSWRAFLPYVTVMAVVTYLIRMLPLTAFRKPIRSRFAQSFLTYIPFAVLGAMTWMLFFKKYREATKLTRKVEI